MLAPSALVTGAMDRAMVHAAERHGKFIARFAAECSWLREPLMVRVRVGDGGAHLVRARHIGDRADWPAVSCRERRRAHWCSTPVITESGCSHGRQRNILFLRINRVGILQNCPFYVYFGLIKPIDESFQNQRAVGLRSWWLDQPAFRVPTTFGIDTEVAASDRGQPLFETPINHAVQTFYDVQIPHWSWLHSESPADFVGMRSRYRSIDECRPVLPGLLICSSAPLAFFIGIDVAPRSETPRARRRSVLHDMGPQAR
jgi:hypothetical protein